MMDKEIKKFRGEFISIVIPTTFLCIGAGIVFFMAILFKESFSINLKVIQALIIIEAVLVPLITVLMLAVTFDYKISVYSNGIKSYDPFGNKKCDAMLWSDMKELRVRNILGYRYYFIQSEDKKSQLWVPFRIKGKDDFKKIVLSQAGNANVFAIELLKPET